MKSWRIASGLIVAILWASPYDASAQHSQGKEHGQHGKQDQKKTEFPVCPLMGEPVDFSVKTMTDDGPVYFCCKACVPKYEKDPAKYAKKVAAQRAVLEKMERVQVSCPVSGNPIDGKTFAMVNGQGVQFCCGGCVPKYEKDPAKYKARLEASYTYQTKCPVSGEKIDATAFTDLPTGQRVYLCCKGCADKVLKNPEKYAENLDEQGVRINLKELKESEKKQEGHGAHEHP
jgi:YHS domain-containing protein